MINNVGSGYDYDISVNCDSVDGSLVLSPGGSVYRKTENKYLRGFDIENKIVNSVDECTKWCDDTPDCLTASLRLSN
jgi:subtilase family serine protease